MKNKKLIILISIVILLILILVSTFLVIRKKNTEKAIDKSMENINTIVQKMDNYLTNKTIFENGTLVATAKYKGAHGEKYPSVYNFNYELDKDTLNIKVGNNEGYQENVINSKLIKIFLKLNSLTKEEIKSVKEDKTINKNNFNKVFGTNFNLVKLDIKVKGFLNREATTTLTLDNILVEINEKELIIHKGNNIIRIKVSDIGYSLFINDSLKMNMIASNDKDKYNIVIKDRSFYATITENEIEINTENQSAIYNGLNLLFKKGTEKVLENNKISYDDIPVFRYYNNLELEVWK